LTCGHAKGKAIRPGVASLERAEDSVLKKENLRGANAVGRAPPRRRGRGEDLGLLTRVGLPVKKDGPSHRSHARRPHGLGTGKKEKTRPRHGRKGIRENGSR